MVTRTSATTPSVGALMRCSIFIASSTSSSWPDVTDSPVADLDCDDLGRHRGDQSALDNFHSDDRETGDLHELHRSPRCVYPPTITGAQHGRLVPPAIDLDVDLCAVPTMNTNQLLAHPKRAVSL